MKSSFSSRQTGKELRLIIDRYSSMKNRLPSLHNAAHMAVLVQIQHASPSCYHSPDADRWAVSTCVAVLYRL